MDVSTNRLSCLYLAEAGTVKPECVGIRTFTFTGLALMAFAANSLLCRMALGKETIDAAGFTALRLISGALVLWLLMATMPRSEAAESKGTWMSAIMLFAYAVTFSFAYISLHTGTGALILFGAVQTTMFTIAVWRGEKPTLPEYAGLGIALGGVVYLVFPGIEAPPLGGAVLMALAGISWGIYSLRGRGAANPGAVTRDNFLRTIPFALLVGLIFLPTLQFSTRGVLLAVISGGITSAIGYIIWYAALQGLQATHAALVQLLVPVLAAAGGVLFLTEQLSVRLVVSAILILGGIALAISYPVYLKRKKP